MNRVLLLVAVFGAGVAIGAFIQDYRTYQPWMGWAAYRRLLRERIKAMPGQYAKGETAIPGAVLIGRDDLLTVMGGDE